MYRARLLFALFEKLSSKGITLLTVGLTAVVVTGAWLTSGPSTAYAWQSGGDFELRCYDVRAGADPTDSVIVQEGDDFVINAKYLDYSFLDTWGIWWDTQQRDGTATEDVDYEPEYSEYHQKTSANNMNHTFHTIDDDLFEGVEYYWAGFNKARPHLYNDGQYCLVTIIDNDELEIRESRFSSTPADGSTYRAGETIEITVKYNGKVAIGWKTDPVYIPLAIGDENAGHVRRAEYLRGAESNSLVLGYTVQPDDFDDNDWIVPAGDKNVAASRRDDDDPEGFIYGVGTNGMHFTRSEAPYGPLDASSYHHVDGRPYVKSIEITSSPANGAAYLEDETIEVTATFDQDVDVEGQVGVSIRVGTENDWRGAWYLSGSGTDTIVFGYTVQDGDTDSDGISIDSGGIDRDGNIYGFTGTGTIKAAGTDVERNPSYRGQTNTGTPVYG